MNRIQQIKKQVVTDSLDYFQLKDLLTPQEEAYRSKLRAILEKDVTSSSFKISLKHKYSPLSNKQNSLSHSSKHSSSIKYLPPSLPLPTAKDLQQSRQGSS